ncbi:MAG: hypothetical protein V1779_05140 [bacterium]
MQIHVIIFYYFIKPTALLSDEKSYWITGQIIGVDGGEDIVHFVPEEEEE